MSSKSPALGIPSWPCAPWRWRAAVVTKRRRSWPISPRDLSATRLARWPCLVKNSRGVLRELYEEHDRLRRSIAEYQGREGDRASSQRQSPPSRFAGARAAGIFVL